MQNLFKFIVPLHVLQPASVPIHIIYVHLHSWLELITSGLTKKSSQGENVILFPCNKFISSSIIMCTDCVAMTCIITQYGSTAYYRDGPGLLALCVSLRKFQLSLSVCGALDF